MSAIPEEVTQPPLKLDIGCGKNKRPGFHGVDVIAFEGVDSVIDIRKPWPWADESVEEVFSSHFLEHLTNFNGKLERVHFFNELHRVMKKGAKAAIIIPHWNSARFYGDPTHGEVFSEWGVYYLNKAWRDQNAPHADASNNPQMYSCDFDWVIGYGMHQALMTRNQEYQQFALSWYREAAQDMHITLTKR